MLRLFVALVPVGVVLLLSEFFWRMEIVKGERARKFIHILAGAWIAFWPFYLAFDGIFILGCVAITFLLYSRYTKLFHAIYAVNRKTYGELFYALAIIICAYYGKEPWVFTLSILLLSLADGGAAVIGRFWGISNQYFVFGWKVLRKSVVGTGSFIILAYACLFIGWLIGGREVIESNLFFTVAILPLGAALLENTAPYGLDNLFTPLFTTLLLNSLL